MTVALARRLVWEGVVAPEEVNTALYAHVTERAAFLQTLVRSHPDLVERLETELGSSRASAAFDVVADLQLMRALPPGLAAVLLAIPIGKDPVTSVVRVLAADASDTHIAAEFSYHLGLPVEVAVAPLRAIIAALSPRPLSSPDPRMMTPAFGTTSKAVPPLTPFAASRSVSPLPPSPAAVHPSEPPIPLVRLSADPVQAPATVKGVAPQASGANHASRVVVPPRTAPIVAEPVIQLTRTKPIVAPPPSPKVITAVGPVIASPVPESKPNPSEAGGIATAEAALEEFERASTPEDVVTALVRGLSGVAARVIVLAARGKVYEGRDAHDDATRQAVRTLVVSGDRPSVLLTAVQTGHYLGPIPQTLVHTELARILGDPSDEIAVGVATVSGRAALIYVAAGLQTAYLATRRGDQVCQAAARALERIVRQRKK